MNSSACHITFPLQQMQQLTIALGATLILLAGVALANDLDKTIGYKKAFRDTVRNDLESQWRTPLSNKNSWRNSTSSKNGITKSFDNYQPQDLDKFRNYSSDDGKLEENNPTLFGLKLKF